MEKFIIIAIVFLALAYIAAKVWRIMFNKGSCACSNPDRNNCSNCTCSLRPIELHDDKEAGNN